ncbi:hypothetical protein WME76_17955 [Sorangium sp. So ce119]|uniref:hypothetical protein n=1 Tax=Sorangium sp. So ce119 TaxID=3133279 RepID=UPI003F6101C4
MNPTRRPSPDDVVIAGVGARSPSGLTALQVAMSARARSLELRGSHLIDRNGDEIATVRLSSVADNVTGIDRLLALGAPALVQAAYPWLSAAPRRGEAAPLPLFIALPSEARPGFDARLRERFLPALAARANVPVDRERSRLFFACRGGGVAAFRDAMEELVRSGAEAALVGGVDSYFDPAALEHLDGELRLHGPATENGFMPGEGAAFLLLTLRRRSRGRALDGRVAAAAVEREPRPYGSPEPCLGQGITRAVGAAAAMARVGERGIGWVLTDVANERHRVDEWAYALARNHLVFARDVEHEQPLLTTGDVGAASAAMLAAIAAVRWATGSARCRAVMVATHSDGPERGALVLEEEAPT